jgi:hypothetical protein
MLVFYQFIFMCINVMFYFIPTAPRKTTVIIADGGHPFEFGIFAGIIFSLLLLVLFFDHFKNLLTMIKEILLFV